MSAAQVSAQYHLYNLFRPVYLQECLLAHRVQGCKISYLIVFENTDGASEPLDYRCVSVRV